MRKPKRKKRFWEIVMEYDRERNKRLNDKFSMIYDSIMQKDSTKEMLKTK